MVDIDRNGGGAELPHDGGIPRQAWKVAVSHGIAYGDGLHGSVQNCAAVSQRLPSRLP
nr:hypothetical protein [Azospirillum sp. 412522]